MELKLREDEDVTIVANEETVQSNLTDMEKRQIQGEDLKADDRELFFDLEDSPYVQTDINRNLKMTEDEFYKAPDMKRYRSNINTCCVIAYISGGASIFGGLALYMMGWSMFFLFVMILSAMILVIPAIFIQTKRVFGCAIFMLVVSILNMIASLFEGQMSGIVPLIISVNLTATLYEYRKHWKEYRGY